MARRWPALDVARAGEPDLLLAVLDDCSPTAVEEHESDVRVFFATADARDAALAAVSAARYRARAVDVSDEDWAVRSQQNLDPVTVGRLTIVPNAEFLTADRQSAVANRQSSIVNQQFLVVPPSMAFGTGHHATTRLCLDGLQVLDLADAFVLDVGTGSGILAIASAALGARAIIGIDHDADAIAEARDNLTRNTHLRGIDRVTFSCADLRELDGRDRHVVTANLTGALIADAAPALARLLRPGGHLVLSGVLTDERDAVLCAFGPTVKRVWQREEDGWIGLVLMKNER